MNESGVPPTTLDVESPQAGWTNAVAFMTLPVMGGALGFFGAFLASVILEELFVASEPTLSHGMLFVLTSLPICTLVGAALGLGLACLVARAPWVAIAIWFCAALLDGVIVAAFWTNQVAHYGRDRSEIVLFGPPLVLAVIALLAAAGTAAFASRRSAA